MILTQGEKMVWAAAFVDSLRQHAEDILASEVMERKDGHPDEEALAVSASVEAAFMAVDGLRECAKTYRSTVAGGGDEQMLRAMLGDEG